ncbi:conserved hypothetical protein [Candidatus Koribacter versatilis Ellin345]|uniref:MmcQ/YjbR family DNA-binding protein n=1 Tax=Koribacter versatilis (strain Ellin345) TaxID=204669 RepID=Q1IJ23_KORVE|nr:MmcQ/YjbR family DNA-binding protein [Candidatus Koribacter versatilis]ABF43127.1 conserved hypothetical protein [Candidatus Koribacter versatilis Ellin345]
MTPDDFRRFALSFPEAEERAHMNHPDFRVGGRIFATLGYPTADIGMVKLSPALQKSYVSGHPKMFRPVTGKWGEQGCTHVLLPTATAQPVKSALGEAWKIASDLGPTRSKAKPKSKR